MKLDGMHHITMITGDAKKNVEFYADVLGLRLVKKTVNFDAPEAYHLYFGDEQGSPGSILTFFPFPDGRRVASAQHRSQSPDWRSRLAPSAGGLSASARAVCSSRRRSGASTNG